MTASPYAYTQRSEIDALIAETCARLKYAGPAIMWAWNVRFTACMGKANCKTGRLRFSRVLWPRATPEQRRHTVVHETCHVIAYARAHGVCYRRGLYGAHGLVWQSLMRECNERPDRCHAVDNADLVRRQPRYPLLQCVTCAHVWQGTERKLLSVARTYQRSGHYFHRRCGGRYEFTATAIRILATKRVPYGPEVKV